MQEALNLESNDDNVKSDGLKSVEVNSAALAKTQSLDSSSSSSSQEAESNALKRTNSQITFKKSDMQKKMKKSSLFK